MQIVIEEHFLLRELDDYFDALTKGISSKFLDNGLPKFWDLEAGRLADINKQGMQADAFYRSRG